MAPPSSPGNSRRTGASGRASYSSPKQDNSYNSPSRRSPNGGRKSNDDPSFCVIDAAGPKEKFPRPPSLIGGEVVYGDAPPPADAAGGSSPTKNKDQPLDKNAARNFIWNTMESIMVRPQNLAANFPIPLVSICAPFADGADSASLPISELPKGGEPLRCPRCRCYPNPYFRWSSRDVSRFQCNMCTHHMEVDEDFLEGMDRQGQSSDEEHHPEFSFGSVDFVAPGHLDADRPAGLTAPAVVFLVEASADAVASGLYASALAEIEQLIDDPESQLRRRICLITFDDSLNLFVPTGSGRFRQVVVRCLEDGEKEDVFLPVAPSSLFVDVGDEVIREDLRELLQTLRQDVPAPGQHAKCSVAGDALRAAVKTLTAVGGGDIMAIHATSPSAGSGAPLAPAPPEKTVAPQKAQFYEEVFGLCKQGGVAVNVVTAPAGDLQLDLDTMQWLAWRTGGDTMHLQAFTPSSGSPRLSQHLYHWAGKMQGSGYSCVVKLRCSKGLKCTGLLSPWPAAPGSTDFSAFELPRISADTSFAFTLQPEPDADDQDESHYGRRSTPPQKILYVQMAVLYTNARGKRFLRVHTSGISTVNTIRQVFASVSVGPLMTYLMKKAAYTALQTKPGSKLATRDNLLEFTLQVLASYQQHCYSSEVGIKSLVLNQRLKLMPIYVLGARKLLYSVLGTGAVGNEFLRKLMKMPVHSILAAIYPRVYPVQVPEICANGDASPKASAGASKLPTALAPLKDILDKGAYPAYVITNGLGAWMYRNPSPEATPKDEAGALALEQATKTICGQLREALEPSPMPLPLAEVQNLSTSNDAGREQLVFMATLFVEDEGFTEMSYPDWVQFLQGQVVQMLR